MFPKDTIRFFEIGTDLKATVLESGNLKEIRKGIVRLNTYVGNNLESTISNLYMRVEEGLSFRITRLIGIGSPSSFTVLNNMIVYKGCFEGIDYTVFFTMCGNVFLFKVKINKNCDKQRKVTIFYGMDISISNIYAISNNEAYVSQYVDHKVFESQNGYIVCSRQNADNPYYLEQGSLTKNIAYSTDGFQFFGNEYKKTNIPKALLKDRLPCEIYQYEFGYCALQSECMDLLQDREVVFYGYYSDNHQEEITKPLYLQEVQEIYSRIEFNDFQVNNQIKFKFNFNNILKESSLSDSEINEFFPDKREEEYFDKKLISFFTPNKAHVVLPEKEKLMERPSGNILISKTLQSNDSYDLERVLADTCYIYGVFSSQIVLGNTTFNKLLSNQRNPLNLQKITGQRIFIKLNNEYQLLSMPSVFEMGLNYCKWYYKIADDLIVITTTMATSIPKVMLSFKSIKNKKYEIIVSHLLTMGSNENENKVHIEQDRKDINISFDKESMTYNKYPEISFKIRCNKDYIINDDRIFYCDNTSRNENLLTLCLYEASFNILILGESNKVINEDYLDEKQEAADYLISTQKLVNNFNVSLNYDNFNSYNKEIDSFNYLVYWYAHNALVHYLSPHGLEQYNGAAWGTRDVCQGPAEFFLATNNFHEVRNILLTVYSHQFIENGSFPQWFMFDRFSYIQDMGSHGDIIVWPARLLALYLESTHDFDILEEEIVYTNHKIATFTKEKYSLLHHLKKQLATIEDNFIKDTFLSCYGGGDWDDTLQPANSDDKQKMVSGWTVSLTYEMYYRLGSIIKECDSSLASKCLDLAQNIKDDYNKYIVKDGLPAGFIRFDNNVVKYIIHPTDNVSKIKYRLLPLTRGMISQIFDLPQVTTANNIIDMDLKFPDGVHLMNTTVAYHGGVKTYFNRAETAANFGREIGLQYCHAHIRYCEAMHKIGEKDKVYEGLLEINPIVVCDKVKNALPRQRNSYYSSSDGNFLNRYDAMKNFNKLKNGEIKVKGGWRIYSSGPGIYLSVLIVKMLGVKIENDKVIFDPILPKSLDGLEFTYKIKDKDVKIKYFINTQCRKILINNQEIEYKELCNCYRDTGFIIPFNELQEKNDIEIYLGDKK